MNDIGKLKELLTPYDVGHNKIRFGPQKDGGYVISENLVKETNAVYSLGIADNCGFDLGMAELGYKVYMYESAKDNPPMNHPNFIYKKMFMNGSNMNSEIKSNGHLGKNILLKMDIEGGEYDLFQNIEEDVLKSFNQMTFEIHDILNDKRFPRIIDKLNNHFYLVHIHANNNCIRPDAYSGGLVGGVPNVIELTYINKNFVNIEPTVLTVGSPVSELDYKNQEDLPEVELNWWLK